MGRQSPKRVIGLRECAIAGARYGRERTIAGIARAQHGVVCRAQLVAAGLSANGVDSRVKRGRLVLVHRGVYRVGPVSAPRAAEMAAVLASGPRVWISHESAANVHGLPPYPAQARSVQVTVVGRHQASKPRITVHRVSSLMRDEVQTKDGIPTTTPARTILDLAATIGAEALEHLLAEAYAKRLATRAKLLPLLGRYPARPGTPALRRLLDAGSPPARTRSHPERRFLALIRGTRLPQPEVNARLNGWEVDFVWPEERLVVEIDALSTHTSPRDFERDRRKDADLVLAGYTVIRVTNRQLEREPRAVVGRVAAALALRAG
jgi:very-short-patch-repair endonuclease